MDRKMADEMEHFHVYVDPEMDTTDDVDKTELFATNSLADASSAVQERADSILNELRRTVPARAQAGIDDSSRREYQRRHATQDELLERFQKWTFSDALMIRPLLLFSLDHDQKLSQDRQNALMEGVAYLAAETAIADLCNEPASSAVVETLRNKIGRHFEIVMIDRRRLEPRPEQTQRAPADATFLTWLGTEQYGQAMLCTILNKDETRLLGHFWIPPITLKKLVPAK